MSKPKLTIAKLKSEAASFSRLESQHDEPALYGITDGKAIGTYLEHKFQAYLISKYTYVKGSSAKGIDLPELEVDIKVTRYTQPQSSCPYKSARQKIYGLGYSLLIFVYDKTDNPLSKTAKLNIQHALFVDRLRTADWQTTSGISKILENDGNIDDIRAFLQERMIPGEDIEHDLLANKIMTNPPKLGYLTISNALQWRLQYTRVIAKSGEIAGVERLI